MTVSRGFSTRRAIGSPKVATIAAPKVPWARLIAGRDEPVEICLITTLSGTVAWELYGVTSHSAGDEKERQDFLAAKGWLANLGSMTETEEIEYQIAIPNKPFRIAVVYLRPPNFSQAAWWPANLSGDCLNIELLQANIAEDLNTPLLLQFAPETWATCYVP